MAMSGMDPRSEDRTGIERRRPEREKNAGPSNHTHIGITHCGGIGVVGTGRIDTRAFRDRFASGEDSAVSISVKSSG